MIILEEEIDNDAVEEEKSTETPKEEDAKEHINIVFIGHVGMLIDNI